MEMKKELAMPMNLQFFAEPGEGGDQDTPPADNDHDQPPMDENKDKESGKTFTRADVAKMVAAQKAQWEQEFAAKVEQERNEAAELAKLSEKERQQALFDKEKESFEQEKAQFRQEQLFVEKGKQLVSEGMPAEFANRISGETAEEILADVKALRQEWDKAIEAKVNERLASKNKTRVGNTGGQMTKAEIMSVKDASERQRLIAQNRELF
ncbi:DUF4355 domain-containing protein [Enterococcus faecium]|uniref:DUF4355 domain-containing protein n=1 Tax=Enterococcus faecium TaxID=1352 RepID=UPI0026A042F1